MYNVKIHMMHEQVYMCSRFIDQLHCLGRATPLQPAGALSDKTGRNTVPGTASKYIFRLEKQVVLASVFIYILLSMCIRIFYFLCIHFLPLRPKLLQSKPPLCQSAVIHDGGEPRRERRRKSVSSASEAFQPLQPLSQRYLRF